jgi:ABC-type nitrate/sulfonate/bicarbonate transport system ATPase subunit/ABC-type nitrate/sulfonate/bicarbonate transport system permease component
MHEYLPYGLADPLRGVAPRVQVGRVSHAFARRGAAPLQALDDVSLRVEPGQFAALVGPSGCGKSTLLRLLAGLVTPDQGTVAISGATHLLGASGYMPQRDLLMPWRSVLDNAIVALEFAHVPRREARARARALLPAFGLDGFADARPADLSGGMRQRVSLLRTVLAGRLLLLLDEPFGALDAITRSELHEWLNGLLADLQATVILVTHDLEEAAYLSDMVCVMTPRPGRIAAAIPISLPRPRPYDITTTAEFAALRRRLLGALRDASNGGIGMPVRVPGGPALTQPSYLTRSEGMAMMPRAPTSANPVQAPPHSDADRSASPGSPAGDVASRRRGGDPEAATHSVAHAPAGTALSARSRNRAGWLLSPLIVLAFLFAWQALIWVRHLESWLLPGPLDVLAAFGKADTRSLILDNIGVTLAEALIGFAACLVVGVALAVAMYATRILRDALYPLVIASQAIPTIAIGAVLVVALGYGMTPKVVVVVLYAFFAVTVSTYDSLQSLDPEMPAVLRTLGASSWQILRTARFPAALPGFFTGAKLAITFSISGAIYGEWVGSTGGLGYALQQAANQFQAATVLAIVVVMALLGVLAFALVSVLERLCVPWARSGTSSMERS